MPAVRRTTEAGSPDLESAGFVRLIARPDGDAIAAAGVLARALTGLETPYQVSVATSIAERDGRATAASPADGRTLALGPVAADVPRLGASDRPASLDAWDAAGELDVEPDPVVALAGCRAAGVEPTDERVSALLEAARAERGLERRPGVAVPTDDPVDGLVHSTAVRASWSGDPAAVRDRLAPAAADGTDGTEARADDAAAGNDSASASDGANATAASADTDPVRNDRRLASLLAIDVAGREAATAAAAAGVRSLLHPWHLPGGPFATLGGFGDVLDAAARERPGTAVALAIGHCVRDAALDAWRDHGRTVHAALDGVDAARHDGVYVVECGDALAPPVVETLAALVATYRSPEPVVLAAGESAIGVATVDDDPVDSIVESIAAKVDVADGPDGRDADDGSPPSTAPSADGSATVDDRIVAGYDYGGRTGSVHGIDGESIDEAVEAVTEGP